MAASSPTSSQKHTVGGSCSITAHSPEADVECEILSSNARALQGDTQRITSTSGKMVAGREPPQFSAASGAPSSKDEVENGDTTKESQLVKYITHTKANNGSKAGPCATEADILRLVQAASGPRMEISVAQVEMLLASVATFRSQADTLKASRLDLVNATTELRAIAQKFGLGCSTFSLFPKLPLELRTMIWKLALFNPQVHGFFIHRLANGCSKTITRTTPTSSLLSTCQESRIQAVRVKKQFLLCCDPWKNTLKAFSHPKTDITLFMVNAVTNMIYVLSQLVHSVDLLGDSPSLSRIAFQAKLRYDIFDDMHEIAPLRTFLSAAETCKIEEIIFVFGIDSVCQSLDVVLISPTKTPKDLLSLSQIEAMSMDWKLTGTHDLTWEMMEKYDRKLLEDLKNEYILRKEEMTRGIYTLPMLIETQP